MLFTEDTDENWAMSNADDKKLLPAVLQHMYEMFIVSYRTNFVFKIGLLYEYFIVEPPQI